MTDIEHLINEAYHDFVEHAPFGSRAPNLLVLGWEDHLFLMEGVVEVFRLQGCVIKLSDLKYPEYEYRGMQVVKMSHVQNEVIVAYRRKETRKMDKKGG